MAKNSKRGLANADEATRKRVASAGGKASHGGRKSSEQSSGRNIQLLP
ncbi:MAG TPA: hypothetical protein VGM08_03300 [Candidatus Saccharimonadales bacterium]